MTRRLRAKLSRISPVVCDSQPLRVEDAGTIGTRRRGAFRRWAAKIAFTLAHRRLHGSTRLEEGTLHNFPLGAVTVIKEP